MSPGTLSLVPDYRITLLGMTFDIGAENQSEVLALHSPLLDKVWEASGTAHEDSRLWRLQPPVEASAACEGFRPQRKAVAEASVQSTSLSWWQFSHSQLGRR